MGKINDYATGTAGPTDKLLASDGGTGVTKNLLVSDIDNFANADLTFTANRAHDTAGFDLELTTDGGAYLESYIYMTPAIVQLGNEATYTEYDINEAKHFARGNQGFGVNISGAYFSRSITTAYISKIANYTLTSADYLVDCTANTFTVTLPTAVSLVGRTYIIKNSGAGTITLDGDGTETIDNLSSISISSGKSYTVTSNGANWIVISSL